MFMLSLSPICSTKSMLDSPPPIGDNGCMLFHTGADYALFTRPETPADRVSYPVPPFTALRGLLLNHFYKRGLDWQILRVWVLSEVRYVPIMRNELVTGRPMEDARTQRRALFLKSPEYVIEAMPVPKEPSFSGQVSKWMVMAQAWLNSGRHRAPPFLGTRECGAWLRPPAKGFQERARSVNRGLDPDLGNMPLRIVYRSDGDPTPLSAVWSRYTYDRDLGLYTAEGCL